MRKYKDLTAAERKQICNGCGGKGSWIPVPNFLFVASCNHHDYNYHLGGTEQDREKADRQFYAAMLLDCGDARFYLRPWYRMWARAYYQAVRIFGIDFFNYKKAGHASIRFSG